jgi:hypothetical protein
MRLIMTLLVRDEVDIVRANLDFHLEQGVDYVIATDNGSQDGTREILAEFAAQGILSIIDEPGDDYDQRRWVSRMARIAREEHAADWIINNDADEFWFPESGNLKTELLASEATTIACERRHMVFAHDQAPARDHFTTIVHRICRPLPFPHLRDVLSDPLPAPYFYFALAPKVLCRAAGLREVHQGNHDASYAHKSTRPSSNIGIYHYPVRSRAQFLTKIANGGAAYSRNATVPVDAGWHWRRWYRMLSRGHAELAYREALPSVDQLQRATGEGTVIVDTRLRDYLCTL